MAQKIRLEDVMFEHIKSSDVLFVDVLKPAEGAHVTTVDVGEMLGFPGQVLARVDYDNEVLYGLTIQNARSFRRKLLWKYKMASVKAAIALVVAAIRAGLCIEERNPARMHELRA